MTVLLYTDMRIRKEGLDLALQQASQSQGLTGDEFMSLWRPGMPGPGWSGAAAGGGGGGPGAGGQSHWDPGSGGAGRWPGDPGLG